MKGAQWEALVKGRNGLIFVIFIIGVHWSSIDNSLISVEMHYSLHASRCLVFIFSLYHVHIHLYLADWIALAQSCIDSFSTIIQSFEKRGPDLKFFFIVEIGGIVT